MAWYRLTRLSSFHKSAKQLSFYMSLHKTNGIIIVNHSMEMIYCSHKGVLCIPREELQLNHEIINAKNKYNFTEPSNTFSIQTCVYIICLFFTSKGNIMVEHIQKRILKGMVGLIFQIRQTQAFILIVHVSDVQNHYTMIY